MHLHNLFLFCLHFYMTAAADQFKREDPSRAWTSLHRAPRCRGTGTCAALLLSAEHSQARHRHPQRDTKPLRDHWTD